MVSNTPVVGEINVYMYECMTVTVQCVLGICIGRLIKIMLYTFSPGLRLSLAISKSNLIEVEVKVEF